MQPMFLRLAFAISAGVAGAMPSLAQAEQYRIRVNAVVPAECELSMSGGFQSLGNGLYRVARVQQFCNTGYQMTVSHSSLAAPALASFRGASAMVQGGEALLVGNGRPVDGGADLYLATARPEDAETFSQTVHLSVSATGV